MKRKSRSPTGKDSCDVWLDPSALKRRKMMNVAKSALTSLSRYSHPGAINGPHPGTKQTTISTFFTAQKAGEKDADPKEHFTTPASNLTVTLEDSELLRGKRTKTPLAPVLQPSGQQDCQRRPGKTISSSGPFLCHSLPPAQSPSSTLQLAREPDALIDGEGFLATVLTQPLEEKGALRQQVAPASSLRNDGRQRGESPPTLLSPRRPCFKIIPSQRTKAGKGCRPRSSWGVADSEIVDPELKENLPGVAHLRDFNQAASGLCTKYMDVISYESSSLASTQRLFTQDSEGHRVILHGFGGGDGSRPSLPGELWWGKRTPIRSSFNNKSCFGDGRAGGRSPSGSLGRSFSPPTERSEKSCYDLLFTEDSEGNKVIKH